MEGRFGREKTSFVPTDPQPDGIDWMGLLKGLLEIRFTDTTVDTVLQLCANAAIKHVEAVTGRVIRAGVMTVSYEAWVGKFQIPFLPCNSFANVTDLDGADLDFKRSGNWLTIDAADGCKLIYASGYGDDCPEDLQLAVLKVALTQYEIRSNVAIGTISGKIPGNAEELIEPYILNQES